MTNTNEKTPQPLDPNKIVVKTRARVREILLKYISCTFCKIGFMQMYFARYSREKYQARD